MFKVTVTVKITGRLIRKVVAPLLIWYLARHFT